MKFKIYQSIFATAVFTFGFVAFFAFFTACSSTGASTPPSPEQLAPALRATVATGATLALSKNPAYVPAAAALVAGIDASVVNDGTITPESIATFVKTVTAREGVPAADSAIFITLAQQIFATYTVQVVSAADPRVILFIAAFKDGLGDAIAAVNSAK